MMKRRQFVSAAGAAAIFNTASRLFAAQGGYDLIIKGGRVIDPSVRLDAVRDVAVSAGRIAAVETNITASAPQTIDARGKIVAPGLIDIHTHCAREGRGASMVLEDGVTGWIDGGSQGADRIAETIAFAKAAPQQARCLINVGRAGILTEGDTMDIMRADVVALRQAIEKNRDFIVGVKARLTREVTGPNDVEVLRRAQQVATEFNLPVMVHMGQSASPLPQLMNMLKQGDIVTHLFAPPPNSIIDARGRVLPEVLAARRRGVWFDVFIVRSLHMRCDTV
jgi:dihydroorotase